MNKRIHFHFEQKNALASSNMHLKANNIVVSNGVINANEMQYVFAENVIKKLICISDSKTQIGGFIFGKSNANNDKIKEVHLIIIPPQIGNDLGVKLPMSTANINGIGSMKCFGWIHTQENYQKMILFYIRHM